MNTAAIVEASMLLPINTRVVHFDDINTGHGLGTIVAYNGIKPNDYINSKFKDAVEITKSVGMLNAVVDSFYDSTRYPYVVQWDNGLKEVYGPASLTVFDSTNPKHIKH